MLVDQESEMDAMRLWLEKSAAHERRLLRKLSWQLHNFHLATAAASATCGAISTWTVTKSDGTDTVLNLS
jgi:hypothetical protein